MYLKRVKKLAIILGTNVLSDLFRTGVMGLVDDAPGLETLDVCSWGEAYIAAGKLLLSLPPSKGLCASIQYLELDMEVWEYLYWTVREGSNYAGSLSFPNLRGMAMRGYARDDSFLTETTPEHLRRSSQSITHLYFHQLNGLFESEHLFILRLCGRSLRCLHVDINLIVDRWVLPLSSLPSLEYLEVGSENFSKTPARFLPASFLYWMSRSLDTTDPSSKARLLKRLQIHIVLEFQTRNNAHQLLADELLEVETKHLTEWRRLCSEDRWPVLTEANVFAFVRLWVPGVTGVYSALVPRLLGKYNPQGGFNVETSTHGLRTVCSCSDLLPTWRHG
jgi:hypothetical protein